jgi:hypothetical protein
MTQSVQRQIGILPAVEAEGRLIRVSRKVLKLVSSTICADRKDKTSGAKAQGLRGLSGTTVQAAKKFSCGGFFFPQRLKPPIKIKHLMQRWKRCATQNQSRTEFFSSLLRRLVA